jgi:hypothetical protein
MAGHGCCWRLRPTSTAPNSAYLANSAGASTPLPGKGAKAPYLCHAMGARAAVPSRQRRGGETEREGHFALVALVGNRQCRSGCGILGIILPAFAASQVLDRPFQ